MALVFCDGFDSYAATADLLKKWPLFNSPWAWSAAADQNGATGGILTCATTAIGINPPINLFGAGGATRIGVGFWLKVSAIPAANANILFFGNSTGNSLGSIQIAITSGFLKLMSNIGSQIFIGTTNVCDNAWHWIEVAPQLGTTVLQRCQVDAVTQWNGTGTMVAVSAPIDNIAFYSIPSRTISISDVMVYDDSGASFTVAGSFPLGARKITTKRPEADDAIQFTPSVAVDATSYANTGGTGNRTGSIGVTWDGTLGGGVITALLDGGQTDTLFWTAGQTSKNLTFDFGSPKLIDAFKWYQSAAVSHGSSNQLQGSNDGSSYTVILPTGGGSVFVLNGTTGGQEFTFINTTAYRYYRITIPGATSASPYLREVEFKIAGSGGSSYMRVDELNGDVADYVESSTPGHQDTYDYAALGFTPTTVNAVVVNSFVQASVPGRIDCANVAKSGGVVATGPTMMAPPCAHVMQTPFYTDPNTSAAWTQAGIDAAKFGIKVAQSLVPSLTPHRYWRLYITDNSSIHNAAAFLEIQMHGGANGFGPDQLIAGGAATADSQVDATYAPLYAIDDTFREYAGGGVANNNWSSSPTAMPHWWQMDFGGGNEKVITGVSILARTNVSDGSGGTTDQQAPRDWQLQYSDDGAAWTAQIAVVGSIFTPHQWLFFQIVTAAPYSGSPHGSHQYWRIRTPLDHGGTVVSITKVEMRATPSGADQCTGGTPTANGYTTTNVPANAFDASQTTFWSSPTTADATYIGYTFAAPVSVAEVVLTSRDTNSSQMPSELYVQYADSSSGPWTTAWGALTIAWPVTTTRVFTDPNYH